MSSKNENLNFENVEAVGDAAISAIKNGRALASKLRTQLKDARTTLESIRKAIPEHAYPYDCKTTYRSQVDNAVAKINECLGDRA